MFSARFQLSKLVLASTAAAALLGGGTSLAAQTPPAVYFACHVPLTGTVYRIKETGLKIACTPGHIEFSWTDGAGAVRTTDPLGGDLSGVLSNATVVRLLGRALSTTPPLAGQVLAWNGTAWTPTTAASGGATSHGALTGLGNDDHPQYLLANGARGTTNGFAVTGTFGTGAIPATGGGTRLMWYPGKAALRAGSVVDTRWDDANVGANSVALGQNLLASGNGAIAIGSWGMATGSGSLALGEVLSSGAGSIALGNGGTTASGDDAVAIGRVVSATGFGAIAIGNFSHASGDYSIALGQTASTAGHRGAFVYSDVSNGLAISATAPNQFLARASGGFRFRTSASLATGCDLPAGSGTFSCTSSRLAKEAFSDLDGEQVLGKIASLSIQSWRYRTDSTGARHVGPTAQDFRAAFGLGDSDEAISLVDIDGINLLGVQALERRTRLLERENLELRARLERLEAALKRFENR
jgi:hypothetical protein